MAETVEILIPDQPNPYIVMARALLNESIRLQKSTQDTYTQMRLLTDEITHTTALPYSQRMGFGA